MKKIIALSLISVFAFASCTKTEGVGGAATVTGKIRVENYNGSGVLVNEYDGQDLDVYIVYGSEDNITDDRVRSSYDGTFEFKYLRKGSYKIYTYSDCVSCANGVDSVIVKEFEITDKKEDLDLGALTIRK